MEKIKQGEKKNNIKNKKSITIEEAQAIISKEKEARLRVFAQKLKQLCEEYNVSLSSGDIIISAN